MSRERSRQSLRSAFRLRPFVSPYWHWLLALLVMTLAFSTCDAKRAELVTPLLNDVLSDSGEIKGHAKDLVLVSGLDDLDAEVERVVSGLSVADPAWAKALIHDPDLAGTARLDAATLGDDGFARLAARTGEVIAETADKIPLDNRKAWAALAHAVQVQQVALVRVRSGVASERHLGALLSMRARAQCHDAAFKAIVLVLGSIVGEAIGLALILALLGFLTQVLARTLEARVLVHLQNKAAQHLLTLPIAFFEGKRRGDVLARMTGDLQHTSMFVSTLTHLLISVVRLVVLAGWALKISWLLCAGLTFVGFPLFGVLRWYGKRIRRGSRRSQVLAGSGLETMQQMLTGIREVKAFQREAYECARFTRVADQAVDITEKILRAKIGSKVFQQFVNDMAAPLFFLVGGWLIVTRFYLVDLTVGQFGAFLGLVVLMYQPAKGLGIRYNALMAQLPSIDRVFELLDQQIGHREDPGASPIEGLREGLCFEDVSFSYDGETPVLQNISFDAPRGSTTALVGHTGSGKSTLADLIARFRDPTQGRVLIDGRPLDQVRVDSLLGLVAVVPQEGFLFNDTIRENIRYGRLGASDADVEAAARAARIHDEILAFPDGYETLAGERGGRLSGGQIQRLAIARALLKRPDILLLDEATSALDTRTERLVQQALEEASKDVTTFVIAHRLSSVQRADQILVLDGGRLIERGTHEALLAQGGAYAALIRRQLEEAQQEEAPR